MWNWDSAVSITTGLPSGRTPGFESRQVQMIFLFSKTPRPAVASTQLPIQGVPGYLPGGNAIGA